MSQEENGPLPKFLILGGCGFVGRHLVDFLLHKASVIYVVDKTPPEIAWLNERQIAIFGNDKVIFHSANLITPNGADKAFGKIDDDVDYVINLASETRKGQTEPVYKEGIYKLGVNVVQLLNKKFGGRLKTFVEFSTGSLYANEKIAHKETDKVDQWSHEAKYNYQKEQEIGKHIENFVIIRPAIVYGPGDRNGITPRMIIGAIYKHMKEMMKLPWTAEMKTHTVHVEDLVRAIHFLCLHGKHGQIYNVVDEGNTTQGSVTELISDIFNINHDYWGTTLTTLAKLDMNDVIDDINDKHMGPWANVCAANGVANTPLSPYIHGDTLSKRHISLEGKKLAEVGFSELKYPTMTKELLLEVLDDFIELNLFPKSLLDH